MLLRTRSIVGRRVQGSDGDVGKIKDIYFDDKTWEMRYLVVDTGSWLDRHEVLLVPSSFSGWNPSEDILTTPLTRKKVEESPPITADLPVSRRYEARLHQYYGWSPYWAYPIMPAPGLYMYPTPMAPEAGAPNVETEEMR